MLVADRDLMDLKVTQLKEELKERGEKRTGNKAWLQRRLHGAMLRVHLAAAAAAAGPPGASFTILGRSAGLLPVYEKSSASSALPL